MFKFKKVTAIFITVATLLTNSTTVFAYDSKCLDEITIESDDRSKLTSYSSADGKVAGTKEAKISEQILPAVNEMEESINTKESVFQPNIVRVSSSTQVIENLPNNSLQRIMARHSGASMGDSGLGNLNSAYSIQTGVLSDTKEGAISVISGTVSELSHMNKSTFSAMEEDYVVRSASYNAMSWNMNEIGYSYIDQNDLDAENVKIAILDTGISSKHISVSGGISFVDGVESYEDDNGHGTTLAGIINGNSFYGNQIGMGLNASLYSVKVLNSKGEGYYSSVINALNWCVDNNMDIALMGFEGEYNSKFLADAVSYAFENGILLIAPSGNGGKNVLSYPAKFDEVLSVGAVGEDKKRASFSNYSAELDLSAPGRYVASVRNVYNESAHYDGTSFAAAHVTGVAALLLGQNPTRTNVDLIRDLCHGCIPYENRSEYGSGVIDIGQLFSETVTNASNTVSIENFFETKEVESNVLKDRKTCEQISRSELTGSSCKTIVDSVTEKRARVYKVDLKWGDILELTLGAPDNCDYDLALYNSKKKYITSSNNHGSADEFLSKEIKYKDEEGTYYILVMLYGNETTRSEYSLTIKINEIATQVVSRNLGSETAASVNALTADVAIPLGNVSSETPIAYIQSTVPASSAMWFSVNTTEANHSGNYTSITLKDLIGDVDLEVYENQNDTTPIYGSYNSGNADETINLIVSAPCTYYIKVYTEESESYNTTFTVGVYFERIHDLKFNIASYGKVSANWTTAISTDSYARYRKMSESEYRTKKDSTYATSHSLIMDGLESRTQYLAMVYGTSYPGFDEATIQSMEQSLYTGDDFEGLFDEGYFSDIGLYNKSITGTLWRVNPNERDIDCYSVDLPDYGWIKLTLISPQGFEYNLGVVQNNEFYDVGTGIEHFSAPGKYCFYVYSVGNYSPTAEYRVRVDYWQYVYAVEELKYGGNGVYSPTGNFNKVYTDLTVYPEENAVKIERCYNSKDSYDQHFGRGWTFSFEGSVKDIERKFQRNIGDIVEKTDTKVKIVRFGNGTTALFELQPDNITYEALDSRNTLVKNVDGTYVLTTHENEVYGYTTEGYLTSIKDKNGNETVIEVNADGKTTQITDAKGRVYTVSYGDNGYVSSITDVTSGRSAVYQYDDSNNLISATDSAGNTDNYTYYASEDKSGYLKQVKDSYGNILIELDYDTSAKGSLPISSIIDEFGTEYTYTYSNQNKTTTITENVENGTPRITTQTYDDKKYVTTKTFPDGKTEITEYCLTDGENKYGEAARVTDRNGNITEYKRDNNGNIIKTINPDGTVKEALYDEKNNVIWILNEIGVFTRYTYDDYKINLLNEAVYFEKLAADDPKPVLSSSTEGDFVVVQYDYADLPYKGLIHSVTDGNGNVTRYSYDSSFNLQTITNPESTTANPIITRYEYNTMGWKSAEISPMGIRTEYQYDNNGNITQKKVITDEETEITKYTYDLNGRVIVEKTPNQVAQNAPGIVSTYYPSGKLHTKTDAVGYVYTYTYDQYGNLASVENPDGSIEVYEYDSVNRKVRESFKESADSSTVLIAETSYSIIDNNDVVTTKKYTNNTNYIVDVSVYDYDGKLLRHSVDDVVDEINTYYGNRLIKSSTDGNGNAVYYTYFNYDSSTSELYNEMRRAISDGLYAYEKVVYDSAGNRIKNVRCVTPVAFDTVPSENLVIEEYLYYGDNLIRQVTDNEGRKVTYTYDADRYRSGTEIYYSATEKNSVKTVSDHNGRTVEQRAYVDPDYIGNTSTDTDGDYIQKIYAYDKNGNLVTEISPNGHSVTYTYDGNDRKISFIEQGTDENGTEVVVTNNWQYDYRGNVISHTDAKGNTAKNIYDKRGNLIYAIDALGGVTFSVYDRLGRKTAKVTPENYTGSVTLENASLDFWTTDTENLLSMNRTVYTYNAKGLVLTETEVFYDTLCDETKNITKSYTYDSNGNVLTETNGLGYVTSYVYNGLNKVTSVSDAETAIRNLPYSTRYEYDALGRVAAERKYNAAETEYTYNNAGKIKTVRAKKENVFFVRLENSYDLAGNIIRAKDGNGNEKTYTYNALGLVQSETTPGDSSITAKTTVYYYDGNGNITKTTDTTGKEIVHTYNFRDLPLSTVERKADGTEEVTNTFRYDVNGNLRFSTDGNGNVKVVSYDALNRPITETVAGMPYAKITEYDKNGNVLSETDGFGNAVSYQYDPLNRLVKVTDANGTAVKILCYNANHAQISSTDALGNTTTYAYDRNNRLTRKTNPLGYTESKTYDDAGNVGTVTDGNGNVTSYSYDENGNCKTIVQTVGGQTVTCTFTYDKNGNLLTQTNGNGHTTTFTYNVADLISSKYDHGGLGVSAKTEAYLYDGNGRQISKTDRNGVTTIFSYDVHGNQTGISAPDLSVTKVYDSNGNLLTMSDSSGVTAYTYDALNRVLTKTVSGIASLSYQYDITEGLENGYFAEKQTDSKGNVVTKIYDKNCRIYQIKDGDAVSATYAYNADGSLEKVIYANGSGEYYSYYNDNTLHILTNKKSDGTIVNAYSYTYDAAGNQISKTETVDGVLLGTTAYVYDSANRLSNVTEPTGKITAYTYDGAGNRITETVTLGEETVTTVYSYNEQERLISKVEESQNRTKTTTYCYDNNGNQYSSSVGWVETSDYIPSGLDLVVLGINDDSALGEINEFNSQDQIVVAYVGDKTIRFSYNGDGIRVGKNVNGNAEKYLYDTGNHVVLEVDENGEQTAENIYGIYNIARVIGNNSYTYLHNGHGDVVALIDSEENTVNRYTYDAFGVILTSTETVDNPFRYTGYWYDSETGLYYLMARYYNPVNGRFLSEDPVMDGYNWYVYCDNNPVIYIDPNGEAFMFLTAAIGAVVGGIGGAIYSYAVHGEVKWQNVVAGAAIGGVVGLTGGAAAASITTGTALAPTSSVIYAGGSWAASSAAAGAGSSYAIGSSFEKWYYKFDNIAKSAQQVVIKGIGRIDAFTKGKIIELKNYDWTKYASPGKLNSVINNFVEQAQKYQQVVSVNGEKVKEVVFYFSSKPPQDVINRLLDIGVKVQWVPKG